MPTFTQEVDLAVSAPRLWLSLNDIAVLMPKIAPEFVSSIENINGPFVQVGALRIMKFGSAVPEFTYAKEKLTYIDQAAYTVTTEQLEGAHLSQGFSKWVQTIKFIPVDDKSCKLHGTIEYEGDNESIIAQSKMGFVVVFEKLTAYIDSTGAYA